MKFVGQGIKNWEPEQDRQTDGPEHIVPHSQVVTITSN